MIVIDKKRFDELFRIIEGLHKYSVLSWQVNRKKELYRLIIKEATDLMNTKMGSLMLYNKDKDRLEIVAARGLSRKVIETTSLKPGEGVAGLVFKRRHSIFCEDIEKDPRFKKKNRVKYYSKSFVSVPLIAGDKAIGVLNVNNKRSRKPFKIEEMKVLRVIADEAAMTIQNQSLLKRLEDAYIDTIQTLAKLLDERIPATRGHSWRVANLTMRLGRRLGIGGKDLIILRDAALIHDIGKIGIPDRILLKPAKLNSKERKAVEKHPSVGMDVIGRAEFFNRFVPIVAFHHEWYNGKGYPMGLSGNRIPLGARIVAVCDAWDAMVSKRPYRDAMKRKDAVKELLDGSGTQFDPFIVKEFLKMIK
ncbi:MAG: GAF domain-containing protein [Elusimicrobia bacterium]|nr:GAF domain-containing protein [Elusimicrobiota bacterium]